MNDHNNIIMAPFTRSKRHGTFYRWQNRDTNYWLTDEDWPGNKQLTIVLTTQRRNDDSGGYNGDEAKAILEIKAHIQLHVFRTENTFGNTVRDTLVYENLMTSHDGHKYWAEKGKLIGKNSSISWLNLSFYAAEGVRDDDDGGNDDDGGGDEDDNDLASDEEEEEEREISIDSLRCLKGLYRGISSSSSINMIHMQNPMRFLSGDHSLPMLELSGDDVFSSLQRLKFVDLRRYYRLGWNTSLRGSNLNRECGYLMSSVDSEWVAYHLKKASLNSFSIGAEMFKLAFTKHATRNDVRVSNNDIIRIHGERHVLHVNQFQKVLFACSNVKELDLCCDFGPKPYYVLAHFLRHPAIRVESLNLFSANFRVRSSCRIDPNYCAIIAEALKYNKSVRFLMMLESDPRFIVKVLCYTSSVDSIINSNHTLEHVDFDQDRDWKWRAPRDLRKLLTDLLTVNLNQDKNAVIRTKISRFYFHGDFDISCFRGMQPSVIPRLLALIAKENQFNAIYNLLRNSPWIQHVVVL